MIKRRKQLFVPALLVSIVVLLIVPSHTGLVFADSNAEITVKVADHLNNPFAIKIITEMEAQKLRYKQQQEQQEPIIQQDPLEEQRKIANSSLQKDLESMEKKYEYYTPQNAFARFVSSLDPTYQPIYWDQFQYMIAKVNLAKAARDSVLESGGSFYEAQQEYFKYASMPRVEMINVIEDLNVKYGFADQNIQDNFDSNGKLPRFENDDDAPCYGCEDQNITSSFDDTKNKIVSLKNHLSELREEFLDEDRYEQKKMLVNSMNEVVQELKHLVYD